MATCPNKNLNEWKSLVASRGEDIAYYLWDKYEGEVPVNEYGTTKKGLFNLIIDDVENFNPRNFPNEVKRIIGLIENKLKIKTRAFVSANIPSYTNKKEYLDSVFKSFLENVGLPSEINTFTELRKQLDSGEVEQYVRSQYDVYKKELQQEFDNRKPTPSIITLENFLKDPTIYERYDEEQQTFVRSAFPALFGNLGRYKSYNQALGHYKNKMRDSAFRSKITSSENFSKMRFYSLNARMKKFETLVNYLTLEPIDFKNRIYNMITNEVKRRSEFYETAPVKANTETLLAIEKEIKYQRSVKGFLESFSKNDNSISGKIAKVFLNHPKTLNSISLETIGRTMFFSGGQWDSNGSIEVNYKDSNSLKHVLLHELTHHFTVPYMHLFYEKEMYDKSWYKNNPERLTQLDPEADAPGKYLFRELSEQEVANLRKIDAAYRHVVDLHKSGKIKFDNSTLAGNSEYGLMNATEFIAEVLSNPYFAAKIAEQPSIYNKQGNLLKDIIDAIFSMFGVVKDGNLLNDVYALFEETFLSKDDKYIFGDNLRKDEQVETVDTYQQMFQLEETSMSSASPEILSRVKEMLKKMGVNVESLADYAKKSSINISGVNAVADLVRGVIAVAEGKEDVALTEEMVHIATSIIEQKNPTIVTEMIAKIDRFKIYTQTLDQYKNNKYYQLPNGKPDIRKIKKEAVDRLIAELIVNGGNDSLQFPELQQEENISLITRWWNAITDFFRGSYKSANIDIFQETATQIMEGGVEGQVSDIVNETIYAQRQAPYIKEDLEELFDSSPELANEVYEALGFGTNEFIISYNPEWTVSEEGDLKSFEYKDKTGKVIANGLFSKNEYGVNLLSLRSFEVYDKNKGNGQKIIQQIAKDNPDLKVISPFNAQSTDAKNMWEALVRKNQAVKKENWYELLPVNQITPQQKQQALQVYSQYLDSIFPDSKVKDVVYHGSDTMFDGFLEDNLNYFGTQAIAKGYGKNLYPTIIEINKPYYEDGGNLSNQSYEDLYNKLDESSSDGFISNGKNLFVPKTEEQIHILGSKQDIEGFKDFVETRTSGEGIFFQLSEPSKAQKEIQRRILETQENLRNSAQDNSIDLLTLGDPDANNFYESKQPDGTWKVVNKRVTDRVKNWYRRKFGESQFTKEEKEFNEFKRNLGVKYHGYFKEIHDRYFNSDGTRRQKTEARRDIRDKVDADIYSKLETYYVNLIDSRSKGGKNPLVFSEIKVYDPIEKEAGSIDLLIIDEDGTANIVDWKFMTIAQGQKDVQWYKQDAYGIQLARYRDMLLSGYGVKKVSLNRAIPILFEIKPAAKNAKDANPLLTGINIGSADPMKIEDLRLLPISEKTESTGYENLDEFLTQLNAVLDKIGKKKATTDLEKEFKKERLNILREAIRVAQGTLNIKPVIDVLMVMKKEGDQIINDYNLIYKDADARSNEFTNQQLSEFSSDLRDYISIAEVFGRISDKIGDLIYNESMEKMGLPEEDIDNRKEVLANLRDQSESIRKSRDTVFNIAGKFADKYMGLRNLISGLMTPEAVVKGLGALFRSVSDIPLRSVKILNKLVENARIRASKDAMTDVNKLMEIRKKLADRGGDLRKLVQKIYQKDDEDKLVNKLIYKYDPKFREGIKNNALEGQRNIKWIRENVDVEAYEKEVIPLMEKRIAQIKKDHADNEELKERLIEQTINKWDIRRPGFNGWDNYILMRHPLPKWESNEYIELKKDKELFELYEFISGVNDKAKEARYLENQATSIFLPWVRKSMAESLAWDFSLSSVMNFSNRLSIKADEVGRGKIDALTKEVENGIPKYYSTDFTSSPDSDFDMSDVSEDLFTNMILYINDMNKYKYLSEVEGQLELVKTLEKFKEHHLETSRNGQVVIKNGVPNKEEGNEENFKIYDQFMRAVLYDQKYPLDDTDITMSTSVGNYMKKAINSTSTHFGGKEVFTINDNPDSISLVKSIETMNRFFQLKALGLEFVSGAVNWFGTNVQLAAQSGTYFSSTEVMKKQYQILGNKMDEEKQNIFIEFINEFMPLREDPNYENLQKAGMSELTKRNFGDFLMIFMRAPEQFTEKAVFMTLLDNIIVQDGKFENIRKVVKQKYAAERVTASLTRLKEIDKEIKTDIQELKKQSVGTTAKVENGKLIIPGFDMSNKDEIQRLTSLTRNISTAATGGINQQNTNRAQMNIWIKSAMVFKNWIPGLAFTRFDHLRKVSDDFSVTINEDGVTEGERYDIGRLRLFFYVAGTSIVQTSNNIHNLLTLNEKGLVEFEKMYTKFSEEYYLREGEPLNMTREEFIDLIRTNLRNQMNELALTLGLVATSFSMGLIGPDDDDTKAEKNAFRYSQRVIDKFVSELTFFINPFEFQNILEGNLLPAIGVVTDITRFFTHLTMEVTGLDIKNPEKSFEDVQKSAQPIKNLAKMFPISKSMINYWAMFDEEFAKEFDITIQKESGR